MIRSRQKASCRYVSAYVLIFGIISVHARHPWRHLGAYRKRDVINEGKLKLFRGICLFKRRDRCRDSALEKVRTTINGSSGIVVGEKC